MFHSKEPIRAACCAAAAAARSPAGLLRPLALGDVLDDTRHAAHAARRVGAVASGGPDPPDLAVGTSDAALETPVALRGGGLPELGIHRRAVFRQHVFEEHLVGPLREQFLVAEDAVVFQRAKSSVIHQIEVPRAGMAGFQGEPQPLLALAQRLGCLHSLSGDPGLSLGPSHPRPRAQHGLGNPGDQRATGEEDRQAQPVDTVLHGKLSCRLEPEVARQHGRQDRRQQPRPQAPVQRSQHHCRNEGHEGGRIPSACEECQSHGGRTQDDCSGHDILELRFAEDPSQCGSLGPDSRTAPRPDVQAPSNSATTACPVSGPYATCLFTPRQTCEELPEVCCLLGLGLDMIARGNHEYDILCHVAPGPHHLG